MKQRLDELIQICKKRRTVEKIARKAKEDPTARLFPVYEAEKEELLEKLQRFQQEAKIKLNKQMNSYVLDECKYITTENVLQICIICMMTDIDDYELIENYKHLERTLNRIEGDFSKSAEKIAAFIHWGGSFSYRNKEELLEEFFG